MCIAVGLLCAVLCVQPFPQMRTALLLIAFIAAGVSVSATITRDVPPTGYVQVPGGRYAHHSCIHSVPDYSVVEKNENGGAALTYTVRTPKNRVLAIPKCKHALVTRPNPARRHHHRDSKLQSHIQPTPSMHGIAWIVDGLQDNNGAGNGFGYFSTNFTVPTAPTNPSDVLIYFWPGLEDEAMSDVLQPVLQYGAGPMGGGNYWVYQSWFVSSDGTVLVGSLVGPIATGTNVWGSISSSADRTQYTSTAVVDGNSQSSVLTIAKTEAQLQTRAVCIGSLTSPVIRSFFLAALI